LADFICSYIRLSESQISPKRTLRGTNPCSLNCDIGQRRFVKSYFIIKYIIGIRWNVIVYINSVKGALITLEFKKRITILSGHFGSGKTEIAINLAFNEKEIHNKVAVNDLDIINPYFRSRDVSDLFEQQDIELIAPANRLATSDLPIVSGEIYRVLHDHRYQVIIDAGGDKDGAMAMGQYYHEWKHLEPELLFVLNANRPYVSTLGGARYTIEQIEKAARLKVTGIINSFIERTKVVSSDSIIESLKKVLSEEKHHLIKVNKQALNKGKTMVSIRV
jgi:hypothetical protein